MKIVHAADLHLDSPLRGLERYEGAPVERMRGATRRALENLVELCLAEEVSLLLLAGDLYDGDWKDYATGLFFSKQMSRLRQADVRVAIVYGNHDAESSISRHLELPDNVRVLSAQRAETVRYEDLQIAVHGRSYRTPAEQDDLSDGYPPAIDGVINIGLLHTAATGRPGHARYAPCKPEALAQKGYDYWALGHVHAREVLSERPWIVFPGNLQGRHPRELGPKGATVIELNDGRIAVVRPQVLDAARWARVTVDATGAGSGYDVVDAVRLALEAELAEAGGRPLAVRVVLEGRTAAHGALIDDIERWSNQIRADANDVGELWIERVDVHTHAELDVAALAEREDAVGQVAKALRALQFDDAGVEALRAELEELRAKLPAELRERGEDALRLDDPACLRLLLQDVEHLLLSRLTQHGRGG